MTLSIIYSYKIRTETSRSWHSLGFVTIPFTAQIFCIPTLTPFDCPVSALRPTMQRNPQTIYLPLAIFVWSKVCLFSVSWNSLLDLLASYFGVPTAVQHFRIFHTVYWRQLNPNNHMLKVILFAMRGPGCDEGWPGVNIGGPRWDPGSGPSRYHDPNNTTGGNIPTNTPALSTSLLTARLLIQSSVWHLYWQRVGSGDCWYKDKSQPLRPLTAAADFLSLADRLSGLWTCHFWNF